LDLFLDSVLRYTLPQMKAIILSALVAAALAVSAAAQDFGSLIINHKIAVGMALEGVVAAWGEPKSVTREYSPQGAEVAEHWSMKNGWVVVFQNGKVASFYNRDAILQCREIGNADFARLQEIERQQEIAQRQEVERQRKAETAQQSQAQKPRQAQQSQSGAH
jgi:hypothetical protein